MCAGEVPGEAPQKTQTTGWEGGVEGGSWVAMVGGREKEEEEEMCV